MTFRHVTHVRIDISVRVIPERAFFEHPNIVEVICHQHIEQIEKCAFQKCRSLRRVVMPGVKVVEMDATDECRALTDVECGKLEIIKEFAFTDCKSLSSIDLQSVTNVERAAFWRCGLVDVKFGSKLERINENVFGSCTSLKRITLPLKDGVLTSANTFYSCHSLEQVDLVEGAVLRDHRRFTIGGVEK